MPPRKIVQRKTSQASPALYWLFGLSGFAIVLLLAATIYLVLGRNSAPLGQSNTRAAGPTITVPATGAVIARNSPNLSSLWKGGEQRAYLSPAQFTGRAREVYAMAAQIRNILDEIYCYCDCEMDHGHKSLASCWVDQHGAQCDVCMAEVEKAYQMYEQGASIQQIEQAIDQQFYRPYQAI